MFRVLNCTLHSEHRPTSPTCLPGVRVPAAGGGAVLRPLAGWAGPGQGPHTAAVLQREGDVATLLLGTGITVPVVTSVPSDPRPGLDTADVDAEEAEQAHSAHQAQPRSLAGDTPHWSWSMVPYSPFTTLGTLKADVGNPSLCSVSCVMADGKSPAVSAARRGTSFG